MTPLEQMIQPAANIAVDVALHAANPKRYHERFPKGRCPLCSLGQNLMSSVDPAITEELREKVALALRDL